MCTYIKFINQNRCRVTWRNPVYNNSLNRAVDLLARVRTFGKFWKMSENVSEEMMEVYNQMKNAFSQKLSALAIKQNSVLIPSLEKYNSLINEVENAKLKPVKNATDLRRLARYDVLLLAGEKNMFCVKLATLIPRSNILYIMIQLLIEEKVTPKTLLG